MAVRKFFRFTDEKGQEHYGEVPENLPSSKWTGSQVSVLSGDPYTGLTVTDTKARVDKVLCPIATTPLVLCIGLNYHSHSTEAKMAPAKVPVLFTKPADAAVGPFDTIYAPPITQKELDYEGELCVVLGRDAKDVSEGEALDYVLGYTAGNDVSARTFQAPELSGYQFSFAKSFDGFAPMGPCIATTAAIPDPQNISFVTRVNGVVRQRSNTGDMIFNVRQIVAHLSQGTTLRKGTVIMTGTPSGVGHFMNPKGYIADGDVVEVDFEGIGAIANTFKF